MFWHFVATISAGLGAAGIALIIRSLTRQKAPKWLIPVFAGLGMLSYQIYTEYTWFDHKVSLLPDTATVVDRQQEQVIWRPWSLIKAQTTVFTVLDGTPQDVGELGDGVKQILLYRFEKGVIDKVVTQPFLVHCPRRELVALTPSGSVVADSVRRLQQDATIYQTVCR